MSNCAYNNPIDLAKDAFEAVGKEKLEEILAGQVPPLKDKISDELEKHAMQVIKDEKSILKEYAERAESAKNSTMKYADSSKEEAARAFNFANMADQSQESAETHAKNAGVSAESADRRAKDAESAAQGAGEAFKGSENIAAQVKEYFDSLHRLHETVHNDVDVAQKILNQAEFVLAKLEEIPSLDEAWISSIKEANEIIEKMKAEILPDLRREQDLADQLKDNLTSVREDLRDVQIPRAELALQKLKDDVIPRAEELIGSNFEALVQSIEEAKAKFENEILPEGQRLERELDSKKEGVISTIASAEEMKTKAIAEIEEMKTSLDEKKTNVIAQIEESQATAIKEIQEEKDDAKNEITIKRGEEVEKVIQAGTNQKEALQAQTVEEKDSITQLAEEERIELASMKNSKPTFDPNKVEGYRKGDIIYLLPPSYGTLWTPPTTEETYPWKMPAEHPCNLLGKEKVYQAQTSLKLYAIRLMSAKDNNTDNPLTDRSCIGTSWVVDEPWAVVESGSNSLGDIAYYGKQLNGKYLKRMSPTASQTVTAGSGRIPVKFPMAFDDCSTINHTLQIVNMTQLNYILTSAQHTLTKTSIDLEWVERAGSSAGGTRKVYGEIWGY